MSKRIGNHLIQARQGRSLSLEKASQETYIRLHFLQALEAGDLDRLPSPAQARGFLRAYASYLGLDADQLLSDLPGVEEISFEEPAPDAMPEVTPGVSSADEAEKIFIEIGEQLRRSRELLSFSLEDVEQHTHVKTHYLEALETGRLDRLPSPVQGRGMLSNYAAFLGMDADPLLLRFAEGLQAKHAGRQTVPRQASTQQEWTAPGWARRIISADLVFGGLLVLGLVAFVIWASFRIISLRSQESAAPTLPPVVEAFAGSGTQTPTAIGLSPTLTPANTQGALPSELEATPTDVLPTVIGEGAVQVYVVIKSRAWMRVLVDDQVEFEGRVIPGGAYLFAGDERVELLTGNGAALQVFYNQQDLGVLGILGEVIHRIFTADGIATPTPTSTPTVTATLRASPTSLGTDTVTTSPTPGP